MIKEFYEENNAILDVYTKAIAKVHGQHHPEVFQVRQVYEQIQKKIREGNLDVKDEFKKLRDLTGNYAIPNDVCDAFRATYTLLATFDKIVLQ
ncbi:iron-sulfur cluster repair di-iron protein, ric [Absicoccus intestinalis]|uniref:Iron-sulfur cluster repair di-iron protein, ric n=1 Tax=Absicoccus intestinalis TaxID=2926319 RepID=A0ABU4WM29_9FIRM|nr:iron-sulfur cluster repair di-iron protein, ric [Absicoccus sp. CLA-KB-P134]MDX8417116.1 iron-sulfur cluster repair di-iron protein, ric [Absicoccus sp. CLA-KB-P134]